MKKKDKSINLKANLFFQFAVLLLLSPTVVFAGSRQWNAEYYRLGESAKTGVKPEFVQTTVETDSGEFVEWNSKLKDQDQKVVMTEVVKMKGLQVIEQTVEQLQIGELYKLKFEDGNIYFETYKMGDPEPAKVFIESDKTSGNTIEKTADKTVEMTIDKKIENKNKLVEKTKVASDGNYLMGPSTHLFFKTEWDRLSKGEKLKKDFGIFELQKLVSFEFKKDSESTENLIISMEPANFFISMFVKSIKISLDKKTKKMIRYSGRTPVRIKVNGEWQPFDSDIIYKY